MAIQLIDKKLNIHCFGDSWTHGIGTELPPGSGKLSIAERYEVNDWINERKTFSWPGQLNILIGEKKYIVQNYGWAGYSNFEIYNKIIENLNIEKIKKGDIVIICLTSIIREPLNFLSFGPNTMGFVDYSNTCKLNNSIKPEGDLDFPNWIVQIENQNVKDAAVKMYIDYLGGRLNENMLYEITMNYICNLQILFEQLGIRFVFMNAFENTISEKIIFHNEIKKENWILYGQTLSEYLHKRKYELDESLPYSIWEDDTKNAEVNSDGPHPNRIGHQFIAELVYSELLNKKLI